jgi:phosphoglycolate phosphatase
VPTPPCFDAVVFDLDGTLVATDRFWIESAERGARRAFRELGLARALPGPDQWLSLVGLPLEVGFRGLFPDLPDDARRAVMNACVEEEEAALRAGVALAMQDAHEVVQALHARGVSIGIASNCEQSYLEHMLDALDIGPLVRGALCRQSPGIGSKADMVARLLADFGTRSAVMVGDRSTDRDAAWENGIPHVHCAFGFAQNDESVEAEGRITALAELPELLARRGRWIERALARVGADRGRVRTLGISGGPAAGKTLFARDAARWLVAHGVPAAAVSVAGFRAGDAPELDAERLRRELLRPLADGVALPLDVPDLLGRRELARGTVLVLEGEELLGARDELGLERLIHLELPADIAGRRLTGRLRSRVPDPTATRGESGASALARHRSAEQRFPPRLFADLVLDATNPLGSPDEDRA